MTPPKLTLNKKPQNLEFIPNDYKQQGSDFLTEADAIDSIGNTLNQQFITVLLIKSEVLMYKGDEQRKSSKVIQKLIDENGRVVGRLNKNSELNMLVYNVKFQGSDVK